MLSQQVLKTAHSRIIKENIWLITGIFQNLTLTCTIENITAEAIVDSYGGHTDSQERFNGVYIYNSIFKNCNITGIVKARQLSYCEIVDCTYDFDASEDVGLISPFYVNKTRKFELNETKLTVTSKDNIVIITLTDVDASKPISGVEVGIFNNGKVFG